MCIRDRDTLPGNNESNRCEIVDQGIATYDWYCSGYPGSATVTFCADGTAEYEGYPGIWYGEYGDYYFGDGLCAGETVNIDRQFGFSNYATWYYWDIDGANGIHDDTAYNGEYNVDGKSVYTSTWDEPAAEVIWETTMTYDWYCSGSYGTGTMTFLDDGTALQSGMEGTWFEHGGTSQPAGLCAEASVDPGLGLSLIHI